MRFNKKFVFVCLIVLIICSSFGVFGLLPGYYNRRNVVDRQGVPGNIQFPVPECNFFCTNTTAGHSFQACSGEKHQRPAPFPASDPPSTCGSYIVKVNSGSIYSKINLARNINQAVLAGGPDETFASCGESIFDIQSSVQTSICAVSCLRENEDYSDIRLECAPDDGDYYVISYGTIVGEFDSPILPENEIIECTNLGIGGDLLGGDHEKVACKLPEYSPEEYKTRCAYKIDSSLSPEQLDIYRTEAFYDGAPENNKCCGNDDVDDNGMIYEEHLCINHEKYKWFSNEEIPFKTFEVYRGDDNLVYDVVSNYEHWFVCMPDPSITIADNDLENFAKINPDDGERFIDKPQLTGEVTSSFSDIVSSPSQASSGFASISGDVIANVVGFAVGDNDVPNCPEGYDLEDFDCDGFIEPEDCDNNPADDHTQYAGNFRAADIYPGAFDPCGDGIDQDCLDDFAQFETCTPTPQVPNIDYHHKSVTYLCDRHDKRGAFVQCCGSNLEYCGEENTGKFITKLRLAGSLSTTLKDFDNIETTSMPGYDLVNFPQLSSNQVLKIKFDKDTVEFGDEFLFPIFINQADGGNLDSDAEIYDFTKYDYLDFFYKTMTNYVLKIRFYGESRNDHETFNPLDYIVIEDLDVKDFIVNSPNLDKWLHVVIPIQEVQNKYGIDLSNVRLIALVADPTEVKTSYQFQVFDGNKPYDNIVYIDRLSLKYNDDPDDSSDDNYYCVSNKYTENDKERIWVNDLDTDKLDRENVRATMYACSTTPGYSWTGTRCCGDDQTYGNDEYYADEYYGCWKGNVATPHMRIGNVQYKFDIGTNTEQFVTKTQVCMNNKCLYPVTNAKLSGSNSNADSDLFEICPESHVDFRLVSLQENDEIDVSCKSTSDGNAFISAENIPLQIAFDNGKFHSCFANNVNLPQSLVQDDMINQDVEFCEVLGEKFFCSYPHGNIDEPEWSDETFFSPRLNRFIYANERNTTREIPFDKGDENYEDMKYEFFYDMVNDKGCCPDDFCFNGSGCVDSIPKDSFNGPGDNTDYSQFKGSFTSEWGKKNSKEFGFDQYVCKYDDEIQQADWVETYYRVKYDNSSSGYCLSHEQCWNDECVDNGYWEDDNYCRVGNWTSRTKLLAEELAKIGLMKNPLGEIPPFALLCDNYTNTLNYYEYPIEGISSLPEFLSGSRNIKKRINNFCILTYGENQENVVIGATLNKDENNELTQALDGFLRITPDNDNCDNERALRTDGTYNYCVDDKTNNYLWLNRGTGSVIYSRQGVRPNTETLTIFSQMIEHPVISLVAFIKKIFGAYYYDDDAQEFALLDSVDNFNTIYLAKNNDRNVLGYREILYESDYADYSSGILIIEFKNFNADVCSKLVDNEDYLAECIVTLPKPDEDGDINEKPTYIVSAIRPRYFNIWHDATAKIRFHDKTFPSKDFTAQIDFPNLESEENYRFDVNQELSLRGSFTDQENIQSFYWDIDEDPKSDTINGVVYGRNIKKNINDFYKKNAEGYHYIRLVAIGYDGHVELAQTSICIDDGTYGESDIDDDGFPNGCDLDDDNDGICDGEIGYSSGLGVPSGGCVAEEQEDGEIKDNCPWIPNGPKKGICVDVVDDFYSEIIECGELAQNPVCGSGKVCKTEQSFNPCDDDQDEDGVTNALDAFPTEPAAALNFDKDRKPDVWNSRATDDMIEASGLTLDDDDDNDGLVDYPNTAGESKACNYNPDCDFDHLIDGLNKEVPVSGLSAKQLAYYESWVNDLGIAHTFENNVYLFYGEASHNTLVREFDTDADFIPDVNEIFGTDSEFAIEPKIDPSHRFYNKITMPDKRDTDDDTLNDYDEIVVHDTDPTKQDTEDDGMRDDWEIEYGLDPNSDADSCSGDDISNLDIAVCNIDGDKYTNLQEFEECLEKFGETCDPTEPDTDGDGYLDGEDDNPVRGDGPEILISSISPQPESVIYYETIQEGVKEITFSVDKDSSCYISDDIDDVIDANTVDDGFKMMDITTTEKKDHVVLKPNLGKNGENIFYINCWDNTLGKNEMNDVFILRVFYDTMKVNIIPSEAMYDIININPKIFVQTNRKAECKIKPSLDGVQIPDYSYDTDDDLKLMDPENVEQTLHSYELDFSEQFNEMITECLGAGSDGLFGSLITTGESIDRLFANKCIGVAESSSEICNDVFGIFADIAGGALELDEVEEMNTGCNTILESLELSDFDTVVEEQCDVLEDSTEKDMCIMIANLGQALKLGKDHDNFHTYCENAKVVGENCPPDVCFDISSLCYAAVTNDKRYCYASYCSQAYAIPYHYSVMCKDPVNTEIMIDNVLMEDTYVGDVYFSYEIDVD